MKQIAALTGLRGLAALMIFSVHAAADGLLPKILDGAYNKPSILLFFILSGYLISSIYFNKEFSKESLKDYLKARAARILPLYLFVIIFSLLISNFVYSDFHYNFQKPKLIVLAFLLINSPFEPWTIPVEFQLYFIFALVWFLCQRYNKSYYFIASIVSIFAVAVTFIFAFYTKKFPHWTPTFVVYFLGGGAIAQLMNQQAFNNTTEWRVKFIGHLLLLIILLFPLLYKYAKFLFIGSWYDPFMMITVISAFYFIVKSPESFYLLNNKIMVWIGNISFGFYLAHRPIMKVLENNFGDGLPVLISVLLLSLLAGLITYYSIEMPLRKMITRK